MIRNKRGGRGWAIGCWAAAAALGLALTFLTTVGEGTPLSRFRFESEYEGDGTAAGNSTAILPVVHDQVVYRQHYRVVNDDVAPGERPGSPTNTYQTYYGEYANAAVPDMPAAIDPQGAAGSFCLNNTDLASTWAINLRIDANVASNYGDSQNSLTMEGFFNLQEDLLDPLDPDPPELDVLERVLNTQKRSDTDYKLARLRVGLGVNSSLNGGAGGVVFAMDYYLPPALPPGDADGDGNVNEVDAQTVATYWGSTTATGPEQGDFNDDGTVGPVDAAILAAQWGFTGGSADYREIPVLGTTEVFMGDWHHFALVLSTNVDESHDLRLYLDGALEASALGITNLVPAGSKTIAYGDYDVLGKTAMGFWDEVRIHDASLSPSEFLNAPLTEGASATAVPEPSAVTLLAGLIVMLGWIRCTRIW